MVKGNTKNKNPNLIPGTHLCCIYETEEEHKKHIYKFISEGLCQNERILYIVDTKFGKHIIDFLQNNGIDYNKNLKENRIKVISPSDAHLDECNFNRNDMLTFFQTETEMAKFEGYSALRVTIDINWSLPGKHHFKKQIEIDTVLNDFFKNHDCLGICLYNVKKLKPELLLDIFTTHQMVMVGNEIFYNNYDQATSDLNGQNYLDILDSVQLSIDGVVISNLEGKIIDVNDATLKLYEFTEKNDLVGRDIFSFIATDDKKRTMEDLKNLISTGDQYGSEHHIVTRSGNRVPVATNIDLMRNENGKPIGYIGIFRDITARKAVEEKLEESEEKYKTLFNCSPEGIALVGVDGTLLDCNGVVERISGKCKRELVGKSLAELNMFSEEDVSRLIEIFPKAQTGRTLGPIDMAIKFGGERGWVEVYPAILKNRKEVSALQLIVRDITERKQTEENMKRRLMKFIMDNGKVYLITETLPATSFEAFKDLLRIGYRGLAFSRTPEREFRCMLNIGNFDFYWLAENDNNGSISPKIKNIKPTIEQLLMTSPDKFVVFLNKIEYLISKNGFKRTLDLVQQLRELAYITNNIMILTVDPTTLSLREQRLLEVECNELKPRLDKKMLAEEQFKLLRYIYENNIIGVKPSYTDIGQELGISKPTIRKRIRLLLNAGYIMEVVKGRNKFVELTQIGKNFFIK